MSNFIRYDRRPYLPGLQLSHGLMSAFSSVLSLAASALAHDDRERDLAIWLASHDQLVYGSGMVGFDISEVPWSVESFPELREFLLRVVDAAKARTGWEVLDDEPDDDLLMKRLDGFRRMLEAVEADHVAADVEGRRPYRGKPSEQRICHKHRIYEHADGCVICNDLYGESV